MKLHHCTWAEVEHYLSASNGIIVPVGSTEQHGPTGLVGTDAICAEVVADAAAKQAAAMVAPTLAVGIAQQHLAFAGSMSYRPSTYIAVIVDWVNSLSVHGFRKFMFVNGHGGNVGPLISAFSEIYSQSSYGKQQTNRVNCTFQNIWAGQKSRDLTGELFGAKEGNHATCSELSIVQYTCPEHIKDTSGVQQGPPWATFTDAMDYRQRFPDWARARGHTTQSVPQS